VRDHGRDAAQADALHHAQPERHLADILAELLPFVVGLRARHHQQVAAAGADPSHVERQPRDLFEAALHHVEHGSPGAVVEDGVHVELGHHLTITLRGDALRRRRRRVPRVHPSVERGDQRGRAQRLLGHDAVEAHAFEHRTST
jgi:hypothetical protein